MELLTNKEQVSKYFNVSIGRNDKQFENYIYEAQMFYLKPLIEDLYFSILENKTEFKELLEGCKFTINGKEYRHEGIISVLNQFVYAIYLLKSNITDTPYGLKYKEYSESNDVEYKERKDWYYRHKEQATRLFKDVQKYIDFKYKTCNKTKLNKTKITIIK